MLDTLFAQFDSIVVLDTETTGINFKTDEIIELAAGRFIRTEDGRVCEQEQMDEFLFLSEERHLSPTIVNLTGITEEMIASQGTEKETAAKRFAEMLGHGRTLIVAYNAQFDLCFLYYLLHSFGLADALRGVKMLDAMTVYKDRRPYPHKLCNAVEQYQLETQNTHRAIDDARATVELLIAMEREENDLYNYVNLFGYNPKYGVSGPRISSVHYVPQGYNWSQKLYEMTVAT